MSLSFKNYQFENNLVSSVQHPSPHTYYFEVKLDNSSLNSYIFFETIIPSPYLKQFLNFIKYPISVPVSHYLINLELTFFAVCLNQDLNKVFTL